MSHVLLIGFMGAGKSTVGELVAARMDMPFVDLDRQVEAVDGRTITQIFAEDGEERFRQSESRALASLVDAPAAVIACGGGVVTRDENRSLLRSLGKVVYLRVTADVMLARVGEDPRRPVLSAGGGILEATALLDAREALYTAVADVSVDTVGRTPSTIADEVVSYLRSEGVS